MLAVSIPDIKSFMGHLLKLETFDQYEVRQVKLCTYATFELNGKLVKDYFEEGTCPERDFVLWSAFRPYVFQLVKGKRLPKSIKLIFSMPEERLENISPKASALFLNFTFENNTLTCITGSSQKEFTMDKAVEFLWDDYVKKLFQDLHMQTEEL